MKSFIAAVVLSNQKSCGETLHSVRSITLHPVLKLCIQIESDFDDKSYNNDVNVLSYGGKRTYINVQYIDEKQCLK